MIIGLVRVTKYFNSGHARIILILVVPSLCCSSSSVVGAVVAILAPTAHVTAFWPALVSPFSPLTKVQGQRPLVTQKCVSSFSAFS